MPVCKKCAGSFKNYEEVNGRLVNVAKRKYCLACSPFGTRNFCGNASRPDALRKGIESKVICKTCGGPFVTKYAQLECRKCAVKQQRRRRKEEAVKELGGRCIKCGYDNYIEALDFHHINPSEKWSVLSALWDRSKERIRIELAKCVLLCSRCHRELEAGKWLL